MRPQRASRARTHQGEAQLAQARSAEQAGGWGLTGESYVEWAPTKEGIETWFRAAAQLAYAFSVKAIGRGDNSQGVVIEIRAQQLLPGTRLHIRYAATYPGAFPEGAQPTGSLWVLNLDGDKSLVDYGHFFKVEKGVVAVEGSTITLHLHPRTEDRVPKVNRLRVDLHTLVLQVRLDVHGDGDQTKGGEDASLLVPTTKQGKKWVRLDAMKSDDEAKSFEADWLFPKS